MAEERRTGSYEAGPGEVGRVLLLYSGGLDTSVMLKWIQDEYDAEVVALTVNLGQPGEDFEVVKGKALQLGALDCHLVDAREEFAREYVLPAIKANALYGGGYPLFTALGRPLIAKLAVEKAREAGCDAIAHGCTGKGNDQVRIDGDRARAGAGDEDRGPGPQLADGARGGDRLRARARHPREGRDRVDALLDRRQPLGPLVGGRPDRGPRRAAARRRLRPRDAPAGRAGRAPGRGRGLRGGLSRWRSTASAWGWSSCSSAPARSAHATAWGSSTTSRTASSGSRCATSTRCPAAAILLAAHRELEKLVGTIHQNNFKRQLDDQWAFLVYAGLWYEPLLQDLNAFMDSVNEQVTGRITMRLYKGGATPVSRESPNALYDAALAGFGESGGLFSQHASPGFIELWSLQSRMAYAIRNRGKDES